MREERQWRIILEMISAYSLNEPLSRYLKEYYRMHKQMGSTDRRQASGFIYSYFRLCNALAGLENESQVAYANFLCNRNPFPLLDYCLEKFTPFDPFDILKTTEEKIELIKTSHPDFALENLFPYGNLVSDRMDFGKYISSFLEQPLLWIRARDSKIEEVLTELSDKQIPHSQPDQGAISLPSRTALDRLDAWNRGSFEVQDLASQRSLAKVYPAAGESWWDACSASGGKSLTLFEKENSIQLTVTDVRSSVLENLKKRFERAGIHDYELAVCDLSGKDEKLFDNERQFDGIIADVPCSGSGTWARTPEWLSMFNVDSLEWFRATQKQIVSNCSRYLKPGGTLVYITCSVFAAENEETVSFIREKLHLESISEDYLQFSDEKADTMFVAIFRKSH